MRIIGEIKHPSYKITVLTMNERITIQIEDRLVSQSYVFRDGSGIRDLASAEKLLTPEFMAKIDSRFREMNTDYVAALEQLNDGGFDDFEII